jgi:hypothetical protein
VPVQRGFFAARFGFYDMHDDYSGMQRRSKLSARLSQRAAPRRRKIIDTFHEVLSPAAAAAGISGAGFRDPIGAHVLHRLVYQARARFAMLE